jgi:hypothetical protein
MEKICGYPAGANFSGNLTTVNKLMNYPALKLPRRKAGSWVLHPRFPIKGERIDSES